MTAQFIYDKEDFENECMFHFTDNFTPRSIKSFIDANMEHATASFRSAVYRRIISCKVGKEWWLNENDLNNHTKITRELVAIWKLVISLKKLVYDDQTVEQFAQNRLAEVEKMLADGEINEQTFIEKCNWIMEVKNSDEALVNCCPCNPIGTMNPTLSASNVLRIVCLPCGWDNAATIVKF